MIALRYNIAVCRRLLVAVLAGSRPLFPIGMTPFAGLVRQVLAKAFNFTACSGRMALGAILENLLVSLVVEFYPFFHLDDIGGKSGPCKGGDGKNGDDAFHCGLLFIVDLCLAVQFL